MPIQKVPDLAHDVNQRIESLKAVTLVPPFDGQSPHVPNCDGDFCLVEAQYHYSGQFVNGKKQGLGRLTCPEFTLEGHFADDKVAGFGTLKFSASG